MGVEAGRDKVRKKPKPKPKVSMVIRKAENQDQHDKRIRQKQKRLDDRVTRRKDAVRQVGGNDKDVARLKRVHTVRKLRLKMGTAVSLDMRGEYAFMLKSSVRLKLGKIFAVKLGREILLKTEPGKMSATPYKLKLDTNLLGAVLGLEGYLQKSKQKLYFGYTYRNGTLKIVFLGQYTKTPSKGELSARLKLSKQLSSKIKLFADVTLNDPKRLGSLSLGGLEAAVGVNLPNNQTLKFYMKPGDKRFFVSYVGRF